MNTAAPPVDRLLEAKSHSDRGDYSSKHRILRQMMEDNPADFTIDSEAGDILGITHKPTGFRLHVPRIVASTPPSMPPVKKVAAADAPWEDVPRLAVKYAVATCELATSLLDEPYEGDIWASPETGKLAFAAMGDQPDHLNEPWVRVKSATTVSEVMSPLGQIFGYTEGPLNEWHGGPRPVASALAGGLLTAGLGYAGGGLLERMVPKMFTPGAAQKRMALLGGAIGAAPGLMGMALNNAEGRSVFDKAASLQQAAKLISEDEPPEFFKYSHNFIFRPIIDVRHFNDSIWNDPFSSGADKAVASGLVYGAGTATNSNIVSPMDVTRMAVGMGTGYASATLMGKAFGVLAGLSPEAQQALQAAGMWSGVMRTVTDPVLRAR